MAGIQTVAFVEIDPFCQKVLRNHWPNIPIIGDVKDVTKETITALMANSNGCGNTQPRIQQPSLLAESGQESALIDIISGGFPCQPHSVAGRRRGSGDERNLWPEFRRCIEEIRPRWVVAENVSGLFSSDNGHFFGSILSDLASLGYVVGWTTYGAVDVGAPHRRDRVFIVAHAGLQYGDLQQRIIRPESARGRQDVADTAEQGLQEFGLAGEREQGTEGERGLDVGPTLSGAGSVEPGLGGVVDGFPGWSHEPVPRVAVGIKDRVNRLKALGNAVIPAQIYPIYRAIARIENA
jgi:DNA (cytosine-5)-methyltransferase 1